MDGDEDRIKLEQDLVRASSALIEAMQCAGCRIPFDYEGLRFTVSVGLADG